MKVIFHNDDFGLTFGFSEAIKDCFDKGVTTSTSVRVNGKAFEYSIYNILPKIKKIGFGIHLNLTDGQTTTEGLSNKLGNYERNFFSYLRDIYSSNKKVLKSIEKDFRFQLEVAIMKNRLKIDHINSHDHIHMIPPIFELTARLAKEFDIRYVRLSNENYYLTQDLKSDFLPFVNLNLIKNKLLKSFSKSNFATLKKYNLKTTDSFYGILHTDHMDLLAIKGAIENALKNRYSSMEILSHPALKTKKDKVFTSGFIKKYSDKEARKIEAEVLKSKILKDFITRKKVILSNYRELE